MLKKLLAVAAVVGAVSGSGVANASLPMPGDQGYGTTLQGFWSGVLAATAGSWWQLGVGTYYGVTSYSYVTSVYFPASGLVSTFNASDWFLTVSDTPGVPRANGLQSEYQVTVSNSGAQLAPGSLTTPYSVFHMSVPGPIAGAGLPLLAGMLGYGAWRRRRAAAA